MPFLSSLWQAWWPIFGCSTIIVFINFGFCISLLKCDAALALLLINLNPLWAALLGKLLLGDPIPVRTAIAQGVSLLAMLLVFMPALLELLAPTADEAAAAGAATDVANSTADAAASSSALEQAPKPGPLDPINFVPLGTGVSVAVLLTYSRWQARASLESAPALGALLTALVATFVMLLVAGEAPSNLLDGLQPPFWLALLASAVGSAAYDLALVIAPRSLTSAEVALILLGETIFGPLWVWVAYDELPDMWTLIGGGVLLAALIGHEIAAMGAAHAAASATADNLSVTTHDSIDTLFATGAHRSPQLNNRFSPGGSRGGSPARSEPFLASFHGSDASLAARHDLVFGGSHNSLYLSSGGGSNGGSKCSLASAGNISIGNLSASSRSSSHDSKRTPLLDPEEQQMSMKLAFSL